SVGTSCIPGMAIPHNPLDSCRWYVAKRACGVGPRLATQEMKARCCRQLEAIPAYCRCEAVRILMDGVVTPSGQHEGRLLQDLPGCPRQVQRAFAPKLVTEVECNLATIHGGPFCLSLLGAGE
nr:inhibitor,alpha amylase trypsin [Eleusine coracana]